jgi:mRNA-degrading endonuclease YafQ of YafQ-DinJ toxin-antitoxin module
MKLLVESTAFRKDRKRIVKRGYDVAKLAAIIGKLQFGGPLLGVPRRAGLAADLQGD